MKELHNIVATTDLSENAATALPVAIALARQHKANLHLVYVEELPPVYPTDASTTLPQVDWLIAARKEREQTVLKQAAEIARRESITVVAHFEEGVPAKKITEKARDLQADCIVMCSHGRSGFSRILFGSVTEEVLRNSPCPVLCLRGQSASNDFGVKPVIVTTDLSNESLEAMPYAIALAEQQGAPLHVLLVLEDQLQIPDDLVHPQVDLLVNEHQEMEQRLSAFTLKLREQKNVEIMPHVLHGYPVESIIKLAGKVGAGCIVIASHGRSGFRRIVVGSVAEEVIRHSTCPVLAIRNGINKKLKSSACQKWSM